MFVLQRRLLGSSAGAAQGAAQCSAGRQSGPQPCAGTRAPPPPLSRPSPPQEDHIRAALGPRYWLVSAKHMFQTRLLVFARMDVVPFIWE